MSFFKNLAVTALTSLIGKESPPDIQSGGFRILAGAKKRPPKRGTKQVLEAYSNMPWLRATTNKISRAVGETEWRIYAVRNGNGKAVKDARFSRISKKSRANLLKEYVKKEAVEEITDHPLLNVLYGGNDFLTGSLNFQILQLHLDLTGEGFMMKQRNNLGVVIALWPIPPHWMQQIPTPGNENFIIQWEGFSAEVPRSEIIWLTDPDPAKPYERGSAGGKTLADELETDEFAAKYTKSFFYNSARPDVIISGDNLAPDDTKRLEQSWLDRHQGFWKSFKPFFISKAVEIKELSQTFQSMQLIELRKYERDSIHQFWGIPPEILGITDTSNRATIDAADFLFSKNVIAPRVESLRVILQKDLVKEYDERIILDYVNPVAEDREFKLNVYKAASWAFEVNEWRELAGEEEKPEGEIYMVPFNLAPVKTQETALEMANEEPAEPAEPAESEPEKSKSNSFRVKQDELTTEEQALIASVVTAISIAAINDRLEPIILSTVYQFGEAQAALLGTNWVPTDPMLNVWLDDHMGKQITGISNTTKEQVRATLRQGILAGESVRELETRIRDTFRNGRRNRALIIARTESVTAANFGNLAAMRQATVEKKMWISSRDQIVRETHAIGSGMDGQIKGLEEDFISPSGATGLFPGQMSTAAESVNCRCTIISPSVRRDGFTEEQKTAYWKTFESDRKPFERQITNASRDGLTEQENAAITALRS